MDDIDRAQHQEEMARDRALLAARNCPARDYESEICPGCSYATDSNFGKSCDTWADCLQDAQKRERARR